MRIGILGGGQLARMLAMESYHLALQFRCLDPASESSAADLMEHLWAPLDELAALQKFVEGLDRITFETENIPAAALDFLDSTGLPYFPSRRALETAQDRLLEKRFLQSMGWETAPFAPVSGPADIEAFGQKWGYPLLLKTRRNGYDGKGQRIIRDKSAIAEAWPNFSETPSIVEAWVPFNAEGSLIAVRSASGELRFYHPVRNVHRGGILHESAPWPLAPALRQQAERAMRATLEGLDYVGVLTLEFFLCEGRLIANEMAPRVHNSGHWSIEGAVTSQFEQHIRAVAGLPLGSTELLGTFRMLNLVGKLPPLESVLKLPQVHYHSYRKAPAPGRKLGHITVSAPDEPSLGERWKKLLEAVNATSDL